ncbi:hypothetical protein KI387_020276, partial [Taxus chinensis]
VARVFKAGGLHFLRGRGRMESWRGVKRAGQACQETRQVTGVGTAHSSRRERGRR